MSQKGRVYLVGLSPERLAVVSRLVEMLGREVFLADRTVQGREGDVVVCDASALTGPLILNRRAVVLGIGEGTMREDLDDWIAWPSADETIVLRLRSAMKWADERREGGHLRQALEAAEVVACEWDLRTGVVWFSVGSFTDWQGTLTDALAAVFDEDRGDLLAMLAQAARDAGVHETEFRVQVPDGSLRWVRLSLSAIREAGLTAKLTGVLKDVTDRRDAEEAMRESEARVSLIYDATDELMALFAVGSDGGFRFQSVNRQYLSYTKARTEDLVGRRLEEVIPARPAGLTLRKMREVVKTRGPVHYELTLEVHGESFILDVALTPVLDEKGKFTHVLSCARDRTAEKRAISEMRRANERFEILARAARQAIWERDLVRGVVIRHDTLARAFGYAPEKIADANAWWEERIHPDDRERVAGETTRLSRGEIDQTEYEYRFRRGDGTWARLHERVLVLRGTDGRPERLLGAAVDVTEARQLEERLHRADRMASLGTLAAGVAHEINNPLAWLVGSLSFASQELDRLREEGILLHTEVPQSLRDAQEGAERIRRIVRDLKLFTRPDDELSGSVDVMRVVESSLRMAHNEIRHRAQVTRDFAPVPQVRGMESRLGQVFLNLIMNAAQAIPEGAADRHTITVSTRTNADGRAVVEIRDTGVGIAPENLRHVFEPFFTTKPRGIGTGLGLSICHNLVTELGGEIDVESELGRGTLVRVSLPASQVVVVAPEAPRAAVPAPASAKRARILVIDDEPLLGRTLTRALRQHDVVVFTSARDALDRLLAGEQFDVILCDVMMPIMTGMEFHGELERTLPHLTRRVVFASGGAFTPAAREFFERTGNVKLEKPFDHNALRAVVDRIASS